MFLEMTEHQTLRGIRLDTTRLDALRTRLPNLSVTPTSGARGCFDLRPGALVGALTLAGDKPLHVRILPKLPIARLMFLLAYTNDPKCWDRRSAEFGEHSDLVDAIVHAFVRRTRHALAGGRLQGYRTRDEALAGLRGRLRFEDQLRYRFGRFPPAEVRFDEFSIDIPENQILRTALHRLRAVPLRDPKLRRALGALEEAFVGVTLLRDLRRLPEVAVTRLNRHYAPALDLARRILQELSLRMAGRGQSGQGFLLDMNRLFEDFVTCALREALGLSEKSFPQNARGRSLTLDEAGKIRLLPDLSWWRGNRCIFLGDLKYKREDGGLGKHPDLYQLLSYVVAAGLDVGTLIYATGNGQVRRHLVRHAGKRLEVCGLNLDTEPTELLREIEALADRIRTDARTVASV